MTRRIPPASSAGFVSASISIWPNAPYTGTEHVLVSITAEWAGLSVSVGFSAGQSTLISTCKGPTVSKWLAPLISEGVLVWCDGQGAELPTSAISGKAHLRIAKRIGLQTPFELTADPSWADGGSLFTLCDLHLDDDDCLINREDRYGVSLLAENEGVWALDSASTATDLGMLIN
jgi:hypothetical protein